MSKVRAWAAMAPGHEIVSRVVAMGPQARGLEIGQRVGVGWANSS